MVKPSYACIRICALLAMRFLYGAGSLLYLSGLCNISARAKAGCAKILGRFSHNRQRVEWGLIGRS
jgi:hypothetical protein